MVKTHVVFLWLVLGAGEAISTRPMEGQTLSFLRQFTTPGIDRATAVAADASGIYVVGNLAFRVDQGGGVRKYDSRGNELWTSGFSLSAPGSAQLVGAAADGTGVYVIGYLRAPSGGDTGQFVRKYSSGGNELWTRSLSFQLGGVTVDATGVYVAGSGFLRKYNIDGGELWTRPIAGSAIGVAVDSTGIYVLGRFTSFFVSKWDARGNELWTRDLGTLEPPASKPELIAAGGPADFYVAGGNGGSTFLRRYDAGGKELWSRPAAASYSSLYLSGMVADASGVYVAGLTPLTSLVGLCRSGSGGDSFVRQFDPDGNEVWTREFGTSDAAWSSGVAVDGSGVYVVGREGTAQIGEASYLFDVFSRANGTSSGFVAKLEKSPGVVTDSRPRIIPDCVVNAASYVGGGVVPGEVVTVFGSAMGPAEVTGLRLADNGRLATTLADTRILFNGVPAPLLYVSEKQSSAIVPFGAADGTSVQGCSPTL